MRSSVKNGLNFVLPLALFCCAASRAGTVATKLEIFTGNNQTAVAGTAVGNVVCVIARDAGNSGISGVVVTWGDVTGGGTLTGATQTTGSSGIATLGSWALGPVAGTNTITATAPGLTGVTFTATGTAGAPAQLAIVSGDGQSAPGGTVVPAPLSVFVSDANGNAASGITVKWGSPTGGGSVNGATQTTDANGVATLGSWTLGASLGTKTVSASISGISPVTFTATATAGPPTQLLVAAGNFQSAPAGTAVPDVICAVVRDANNIPVAGATVTWSDVTGGGSLSGETQLTDASGVARLGGWTLGASPGINTTTANSAGLPSITFTATGEAGQAQANAVILWNNALLQAVKNTQTSPTISSRALAIVHTAMFDAWAAYDATAIGTKTGATLRRPEAERTDANKEAAIGFAAYRTLVDLFPTQATLFDAVMTQRGLDATDLLTDTTTPGGIGNTAAAKVLEFRHSDGANQLGDLAPGAYADYTAYAPVNDPDTLNNPARWQPLRLETGVTQVFLTPQWGKVAPFAIGASRAKLLPKPPAKFPGKPFEKESKELLTLSAALNDTTKAIAMYWADDEGSVTPPGHWFKIAQQISVRDKHTLDDDVKLFFALGNAVLDAGIISWDCKTTYDSVRPISAIRSLDKGVMVKAWGGPGLGTVNNLGENWQPYSATPAFAEYVSGHSTFSAAAAQILRSFTKKDTFGGSAIVPAGSSLIEPNTPAQTVTLSWKKFSDAANEAGMSRRYGGTNFKDGDMNGRKLGKLVGTLVWKKAQEFIAPKGK